MKHFSIDGEVVAQNIKKKRKEAKLTQEQVARELNVTTKTYISYEKNAKSLKATKLYDLSIIFKCNMDDFFCQ